jgi:20S proteasome alpha/beta subunit
MTLQVALVATDGVVLASDKKVNILKDNLNSTALRTKIYIGQERKILACWSGEQFPSSGLAERIALTLGDPDLQFPYPVLRTTAQEILSQRGVYGEEYGSAEVLVVTIQDEPKAYEITVTRERCDCVSQPKIVKGHIASPALFFTERFYETLPMSALLPLAVHVIATAGQISPRSIEGLEVIRCTRNGFERISNDEIADLVKWSKKLDKRIKRLVLSGPKASKLPR